MTQYRTTITFLTTEPVSPDHLATRLVQAAEKYNALRVGEGCILPSDPAKWVLISDEPVDVDGIFK